MNTQDRIQKALDREGALQKIADTLPDEMKQTVDEQFHGPPTPPAKNVFESESEVELAGEVESNGYRLGGNGSRLGKLRMNLKKGGSITGDLSLDYLDNETLAAIKKINEDRSARKYKIKLTITQTE